MTRREKNLLKRKARTPTLKELAEKGRAVRELRSAAKSKAMSDFTLCRARLEAAFEKFSAAKTSAALFDTWSACVGLSETLDRLMSLDPTANDMRFRAPPKQAAEAQSNGRVGRVIWTGQTRKPGSHRS